MNDEGEIIIVSQKGISWSFPKGHLEHGEDQETTAKREIYEETGIKDFEIITSLGSFERPVRDRYGKPQADKVKRIHMFFCRTTKTMLKPVDSDNPEARWVTPQDALRILTYPEDREFLKNIMHRLIKRQ